jgi:hypothetical protein
MPRLSFYLRVALPLFAFPGAVRAEIWEIRPQVSLPGVDGVAQKVELLDFDADGYVDLVFANSRGDSTGSEADAQLSQLLRNEAGMSFSEVPIFDEAENTYAIKAGDLDGDGDLDLVVGVNFSGQSYALLNEGGGVFTRQDILPGQIFSIGDVELGDVDDDGDLDVVAVDWGTTQPYGAPGDPGGPVRLWLGAGDGTFSDGQVNLPMGLDNVVSWSFDLELLDFDNDFDLDVLVSSRGPGYAIALRNDGAGVYLPYPLPAVQNVKGKESNAAFTPIDLTGDGWIDVVTLQDGGDACVVLNGVQYCGSGNSVLISDGLGQFVDNPGGAWGAPMNAPRHDADVAALDIDMNGLPDLIVLGPPPAPNKPVALYLRNVGDALAVNPVSPFPPEPALNGAFGLMFADFDRDRREDVAVAVRDDTQPNFVLFGRNDPIEGLPEDTEPPTLGIYEQLPGLVIAGQSIRLHARVDDRKTPTRWHDFQYDPALDTYNLSEGSATAHHRRLPWIEHALGLGDPAKLADLPDTGPVKLLVPGVWIGESLWRFDVTVPIPANNATTTLTWRLCAIDAAGNKRCNGPFEITVEVPEGTCGDGIVDPWEECDDPNDPFCVQCEQTCGDGVCQDPPESQANCPQDCPCDNDGRCEPPSETDINCADCLDGESGFCGDSICQSPPESKINCPKDCKPTCGDCLCEPPEDAANCAKDCAFDSVCATCGNSVCDEPMETLKNCPVDCPPTCGNCFCEQPYESPENCPADCSSQPSCACGDGICQPAEPGDCPQDCPDPTTSDSASTGPETADNAACGCRDTTPGTPLLLALLALLPRRRRR